MTIGFVVGICAGGILPAVIVSEVINASTTDTLSTTTNVCSCTTSFTMIASGFFGTERVNLNFTHSGVELSLNPSQILYSWRIISDQTISSSGFPYYIEAQYQLQVVHQTVANDTYSILSQSS